MQLELIKFDPPADTESKATPLLFVHGAWHGAWCWQEHFLPYFAAQGYPSLALSLRGHGQSAGREKLRWTKLAEYVEDLAEVASQLDQPPVLIGHSLGGLVVQHYLKRYPARAVILLASVPPQGALKATLRFARRHPWIYTKACLSLSLYPLVSTPALVREDFFSNQLSQFKVEQYARQLQDEAFRAYLDLIFSLPRLKKVQIPFLVLGAAEDQIISPAEVAATARAYQAQTRLFERMGHDLMLDQGWEQVADHMLDWLAKQKLDQSRENLGRFWETSSSTIYSG
jgi:pimeloyl-ACP methyl ester carboxylesterase